MEPGAAVNQTKADQVLGLLSSNEPTARRQALHALKEIQQTVRARQKRIKTYALTVFALERQYAQWQQGARSQLTQLDTAVADLNHQVLRLRQQRSETEQRLSGFEHELNGIREYAQQRRTKKTKREKQYNHFYFVPVLSTQYHKKYVRAHDKNALAEEQVVQLRESIEECQQAVRQAANLLGRKQQEHSAQMEQREAVHHQVAEADQCLNYLHQGQEFWDHFDQYQAAVVIDACDRLIERFRSNSGDPQIFARRRSTTLQDGDRDYTVIFKSICSEYGEREAYGAQKWDNVEVEFDCARCRQSLVGWPTPDKVHASNLLCAACYQETRTSMIMEKKMNAFSGKLGIERPVPMERRQSSSNSSNRLSTVSTTSTKRPSLSSSSSFVGDATKKVFKIFSSSKKHQQQPVEAFPPPMSMSVDRPLPPSPPAPHFSSTTAA